MSAAQLLGFTMVSLLFFISSGMYSTLIEKKNIGVFQFIYFFSSFWGQFGPNCTTFLLAGALLCRCAALHRLLRDARVPQTLHLGLNIHTDS